MDGVKEECCENNDVVDAINDKCDLDLCLDNCNGLIEGNSILIIFIKSDN